VSPPSVTNHGFWVIVSVPGQIVQFISAGQLAGCLGGVEELGSTGEWHMHEDAPRDGVHCIASTRREGGTACRWKRGEEGEGEGSGMDGSRWTRKQRMGRR
jgi:hypothetical protein